MEEIFERRMGGICRNGFRRCFDMGKKGILNFFKLSQLLPLVQLHKMVQLCHIYRHASHILEFSTIIIHFKDIIRYINYMDILEFSTIIIHFQDIIM